VEESTMKCLQEETRAKEHENLESNIMFCWPCILI